jgi:hypothetical protein
MALREPGRVRGAGARGGSLPGFPRAAVGGVRAMWIAGNGRVYDFRELRTGRERRGHRSGTPPGAEAPPAARQESGVCAA